MACLDTVAHIFYAGNMMELSLSFVADITVVVSGYVFTYRTSESSSTLWGGKIILKITLTVCGQQ